MLYCDIYEYFKLINFFLMDLSEFFCLEFFDILCSFAHPYE